MESPHRAIRINTDPDEAGGGSGNFPAAPFPPSGRVAHSRRNSIAPMRLARTVNSSFQAPEEEDDSRTDGVPLSSSESMQVFTKGGGQQTVMMFHDDETDAASPVINTTDMDTADDTVRSSTMPSPPHRRHTTVPTLQHLTLPADKAAIPYGVSSGDNDSNNNGDLSDSTPQPQKSPADFRAWGHHHTATGGAHRRRNKAFASVTSRPGDRFLVLQQDDASTPILRDFSSAAGLVAYLRANSGNFRALAGRDTDGTEPSAHVLERQLKAMHNWDEDGEEARNGSSNGNSTSSSSSTDSSVSTMSGLAPECTMWIDVQCSDASVVEEILSCFPRLGRETVEDLLQHEGLDTAHWYHAQRCLFSNMDCATRLSNGDYGASVVSLVAFSDVCITVHKEPFIGHRSSLETIHSMTRLDRRSPGRLAGHDTLRETNAFPPHSMALKNRKRLRLTIGAIVATLIENIVIRMLPDPTACLNEVDQIDEMVLMVRQGQRGLLRRIARTRRLLSTHRSALYRKERFLQQFTSPALASTFISGFNAEQYRHTLGEVYHVAERLEAARDVLTQANNNFMSHISLQTARVSNNMNRQMKLLSQVATICLPLNIVTGAWGMNVHVPFSESVYPNSLLPFFLVLSITFCVLLMLVGLALWCNRRQRGELNDDEDDDEFDKDDAEA
jgi:Mg2+ and Co2+ transporter CorA